MKSTVILLLSCAAVLAQAPESRGAADSQSDAKAVEIFKKALAAQSAGGPAIPVRDFQAELQVTMHETDPKTKERVRRSAEVIEFYRDRGKDDPLYRRHLIDKVQNSTTVQGYDGRTYWQKLGNTPPRDLRGRESKDDRDRIRTERDRTKDFVRLLLLSNYEGAGVTFRHGGRTKFTAGDVDRDVDVVLRERQGEAPLELMIGDDKGKTVLFGLKRKTAAGKTELVAFSFHTPIATSGGTILVPLVAQYFEEGVINFEARASKGADVKVNTNIDDSTFRIPPR
jgi:hypothetical protein